MVFSNHEIFVKHKGSSAAWYSEVCINVILKFLK